jgi:cell division inhibitor SepF
MAGSMHKAMVYLGLAEDADDGYEAYETDEDFERAAARPAVRSVPARESEPVREPRGRQEPRYDSRTETRQEFVYPEPPRDLSRITPLHPRNYNDAKAIGLEFRQGVPVILNLTELDDADAKRIVDFSAGLAFGLHGSIERVTSKVFLLSPANVDVGAEARARIAEGGFFNQS